MRSVAPVVSVIVPVYNAQERLSRCIDSILAQDFESFEVILINDGSVDESRNICENYVKQDNRIQLINQTNSGPSAARNAGLDAARGDFITFVDSDDEIETDFFSLAVSRFQNAELYMSGIRMISGDSSVAKKVFEYLVHNPKFLTAVELLSSANIEYPLICFCGPWCKLYLREIIREYNIRFDPSLSMGEDTYFNLSYIEHVNSVFIDSKINYIYHRENENSLFSRYTPQTYEIHEKVYGRWRKDLIRRDCSSNQLNQFDNLYIELLIGCIVHVYSHSRDLVERRAIIKKVAENVVVSQTKPLKGSFVQRMLTFLLKYRQYYLVNAVFSLRYDSFFKR